MITLLDVLILVAIGVLIVAGVFGLILCACTGVVDPDRVGPDDKIQYYVIRRGRFRDLPPARPSTPLDVLGGREDRR